MGFSLWAIFVSEFIAMMLTIFLGEAVLANELLQGTKGHGLGFLGVTIGFGLAFGVNIAWFGFISAHLNPAMFFFLVIQGDLEYGWAQWAVGTVADFLGAFVGACLVWIFFLPHFGASLPLPPDSNDLATLVYGPSGLDENAGRLASAFGDASRAPAGDDREPHQQSSTTNHGGERLRRLFGRDGLYDDDQREALLQKMEMRHANRQRFKVLPLEEIILDTMTISANAKTVRSSHRTEFSHEIIGPNGQLRRANSITVATLNRHNGEETSDGAGDSVSSGIGAGTTEHKRRHSIQVAAMLHEHDKDNTDEAPESGAWDSTSTKPGITALSASAPPSHRVTDDTTNTVNHVEFQGVSITGNGDEEKGHGGSVPTAAEEITPFQQRELAQRRETYEAAIKADSAAKLSIFATRPAIYSLPFNFMQEAVATAVLLFGASMFEVATEAKQEQSNGAFVITAGNNPLLTALWVSFFITLLILGLGGVTGLAVNPARDIGPRLAHWILPFPNKGPSEWSYGLVVPMLAPYVGACLAAGLNQAMIKLYETGNQDEL